SSLHFPKKSSLLVEHTGTNGPESSSRSMLDPHFVYVNEYMNWSDAQNYCREHFTDLATVRNDTENLKIHKLLTENKDSWIGLFRDPHFYWSDGSVFSFSYWYTDYNYLGSRTLVSVNRQMVKLRMKMDSSVTPSDPAVRADILKKASLQY
uniref:C-type lectin domain-containing protein n=1 Tax=Scophthalmus maximus TaxID=52904 RepID=A0A8D3CID5_SCOMX